MPKAGDFSSTHGCIAFLPAGRRRSQGENSIAPQPTILVVRVGALGDTLMVTPLLRALRNRSPKAEIDMLASALAAPLLECNTRITRLFSLRGRNWPLALSPEKQRLQRQLRARNYDLAIVLESAPRYRHLIERIGARRILSFDETPFDALRHAIVNNMRVAGLEAPQPEDLDMDLPLSPADLASAQNLLRDLPKPRIGVHMGWGPLGKKRDQETRLRGWHHSNFTKLLRTILDHSAGSIVLTGSPQDAPVTQQVCQKLDSPRLHSIAGQTRIRELAAVIKNLDLFVSVDSGPCHMAAALGTPLVVLWGPGRLEQTRPLSSTSPIRILRHAVPCAPCQSTPMQKSCRHNLCMEAITPAEVFTHIEELLRKKPATEPPEF
jgi:ADP-heptose:LPS heptosyltransferase